jgi:hypothetical protein
MSQRMTLERAHAEHEMLEKLWKKLLGKLEPVVTAQGSKLPSVIDPRIAFESSTPSPWRSLLRAVARMLDIKAAIYRCNTTISLTVFEEDMSMAEAIIRIDAVEIDLQIARAIHAKYMSRQSEIDTHNESTKDVMPGIEKSCAMGEFQTAAEGYTDIVSDVEEMNKAEVVDLFDFESLLREKENIVNNFRAEVNRAIVSANAIVFIDISVRRGT